MTDDRIKRLLWRWGAALNTCYRKQQDIERLKQLCVDAIDSGSPVLTGMPKSSKILSSVELAVEKRIDTYETAILRLENDIIAEMSFKEKVDAVISELPPIQQKVIVLKYWYGYDWQVVPKKMHYSRSRCFTIHDEAVQNIGLNWTLFVL